MTPTRARPMSNSPIERAALPFRKLDRAAQDVAISIVLARIAGSHPCTEYQFDHDKAWRLDYVWHDLGLAVEIEGSTFAGGRHNRGSGFMNDCMKYMAAQAAGWRVVRIPREMFAAREIKKESNKRGAMAKRFFAELESFVGLVKYEGELMRPQEECRQYYWDDCWDEDGDPDRAHDLRVDGDGAIFYPMGP